MPNSIQADRLLHHIIGQQLRKIKKHLMNSYRFNRAWQLEQFKFGYRADWSSDELLLRLKSRIKALQIDFTDSPSSPYQLQLPMILAAHEIELEASCIPPSAESKDYLYSN